MKGLWSDRVARQLRTWELQGGPTRLERATARRPLGSALLHGVGLTTVLALVAPVGGLNWITAVSTVAYVAFVYIRGREHHAALARLRAPVDAAATPGGHGMAMVQEPKHPALRAVYWREEILGVVLWLRGEGWDDGLDADVLQRFLGVDLEKAVEHLGQLADQGYLERRPDGRLRLTSLGEEEGRRIVEGDRAVPPPTSGPCGPECWCSTSPMEASQCAPAVPG